MKSVHEQNDKSYNRLWLYWLDKIIQNVLLMSHPTTIQIYPNWYLKVSPSVRDMRDNVKIMSYLKTHLK